MCHLIAHLVFISFPGHWRYCTWLGASQVQDLETGPLGQLAQICKAGNPCSQTDVGQSGLWPGVQVPAATALWLLYAALFVSVFIVLWVCDTLGGQRTRVGSL